jgi:hypothetical protein
MDLTLVFRMSGSSNDINMLQRLPVFDRLAKCSAPQVSYEIINGNHYNKGYYLVDGIHPFLSTFVKTVCNPED